MLHFSYQVNCKQDQEKLAWCRCFVLFCGVIALFNLTTVKEEPEVVRKKGEDLEKAQEKKKKKSVLSSSYS